MANDRGIEKQIRALREARFGRRSPVEKVKPESKLPPAPPAANQETAVKKPKAKKTAVKRKPAAKKAKTSKKTSAPKTASNKKGVPAVDVGAMICREGGASMAELEAKFGIDSHPMRAKIHYLKHKLGYKIEAKDGRYTGSAPLGGP